MNKDKKLALKKNMISRMKQANLKGGLVSKELIAGCCTQGCCGGGELQPY